MTTRRILLLAGLLSLAGSVTLHAQGRGGRRAAQANGWIFDDFAAGLRRARQSGKPLMIVLRCPP